ncbi:MAG: endonuclease/exonuclease/phosphatase family protein [Burkholderiaceae bacterium]|jgi:endonuclease/exonuclease/phosphatase family metal-dependent hydrolase|nr:endonuclease/exonuclease/phosphatase family protein [Burkholderiaceae bacterium]
MKLRVATYNIHKGVMGLRQKVRIHDVRLALKAIDADIVFLQEVQDRNERLARRVDYPEGTQLDYLCTGSYLHRAYGMNAVYPHGHHGNAIVSRHAIGVFLNHDISDHVLEKRGLLHAVSHLEGRNGVLDVHLINTHFGLIKRSRVRQAGFLVDFVRSEVPPNAPLIIAGDFNDWQRGVDEVLREELGVVEAASEFNGRQTRTRLVDRLMPWRGPRSARPQVARTYPSVMPWLMLDRIYLRGFRVHEVRVPKGLEWSQRSDHMPLIADLEVK